MGSSVLIMVIGMLVPVLAAAPFYVLDHRAEQRADEARRAERARLQAASAEQAESTEGDPEAGAEVTEIEFAEVIVPAQLAPEDLQQQSAA